MVEQFSYARVAWNVDRILDVWPYGVGLMLLSFERPAGESRRAPPSGP